MRTTTMKLIIYVTGLICTSWLQSVTAVDVENGERVGGCPTPIEVSNMPRASAAVANECNVDSDCTGNAVHKCCPEHNTGLKVCVKPVPACRDGKKIFNTRDIFERKCSEIAATHCIDRGCEDGPEGEDGWGSACCGGYAFEWIPGVARPTCGNGVEPLKDSEGEYFWCGPSSVRSCPSNSACTRDEGGYEICCPAPGVPADRCELPIQPGPCEAYMPSWGFNPTTNQCEFFAYGGCQGNANRFPTQEACYVGCNKGGCACIQGHPVCQEGWTLQNKQRPGACCPDYECVENVCTPGEQYTIPENPCRNCLCGDDGQPTEQCTEIACAPPYCGPGKTFRSIPGFCCKFECIDLAPVCKPGEYYTMPDNPCKDCRCGSDGRPTDQCRELMCDMIICPEGQRVYYIPKTCCGQKCVPIDNSDNMCHLPVEKGPCEAAISAWGYNSVAGRCEHFLYGGCEGNDNNFDSEDECTSWCGKPGCRDVPCAVPSCSDTATLQKTEIPGACCPRYQCVSDNSNPWIRDGQLTVVGIISVVIVALIVIVSVTVLVFCYIYMKKHRSTGPDSNQNYDNPVYIDEKKKIPQDNVYIVREDSDLNNAKLLKEKEAL